METPLARKPVIIFSALLFTAIVTGTIFTNRELNAKETESVLQTAAPSSKPDIEEPEVTPTPLETLVPEVSPMQKPSVNVKRGDDDEDDD